jgi:hypothetical protein
MIRRLAERVFIWCRKTRPAFSLKYFLKPLQHYKKRRFLMVAKVAANLGASDVKTEREYDRSDFKFLDIIKTRQCF